MTHFQHIEDNVYHKEIFVPLTVFHMSKIVMFASLQFFLNVRKNKIHWHYAKNTFFMQIYISVRFDIIFSFKNCISIEELYKFKY